MTDTQLLTRITLDPKIMVGKPVIKGTRLTVECILGLTREDIQACLLFATKSLESTVFMPLAETA